MLLNEIEIQGSSFSVTPLIIGGESNAKALFDIIMTKGDMFSLETELPGFHDCEYDSGIIRGYYSHIEPFEVEHLVEGITTKTLFKRIKSCEFVCDGTTMFAWDDSGSRKLMTAALSAITGNPVETHPFEFQEMSGLQNCMTNVKSVAICNPREKEVRKCRMSGHIEEYTEYNVLDPKNHGIESVSGIIDTPLGPMTITATSKGAIRLNVKKGLILTFDALKWIFNLIVCEQPIESADEEKPENAQPDLPFEGVKLEIVDFPCAHFSAESNQEQESPP